MKYDKLVAKIAALTKVSEEAVRKVLFSIPDALIGMEEKDMVRTPLGVFRMTKRSSRTVKPPKSAEPVVVPEEMVVKLRAGSRLRKPT